MEVIVSMASFGNRLKYESKYAIQSILNNTILPNKIIVAIESYDKDKLPEELLNNPLIEVIIGEYDIRSHNKYYHAMVKYPNALIITIDDDAEYCNTFVEECIKAYNDNPNVVNACRLHKIKYNNGRLLPYLMWEWGSQDTEESYDLFFTGVGGVVYPPNIFNSEDLNIENIKQYLEVDDIYLNYLCRKHRIKIKKIPIKQSYKDIHKLIFKPTLCRNNIKGGNDIALSKIEFEKVLNECKKYENTLA